MLALVTSVVVCSGAQAQEKRTFAQATSGPTFGSGSSSAVGGELATAIEMTCILYGSAEYHEHDVLPTSVGDTFRQTVGQGYSMRAPSFPPSGGVRYRIPIGSGIRPEHRPGAGAGIASIKLRIHEENEGDVTESLISAGMLSGDGFNSRRPMAKSVSGW